MSHRSASAPMHITAIGADPLLRECLSSFFRRKSILNDTTVQGQGDAARRAEKWDEEARLGGCVLARSCRRRRRSSEVQRRDSIHHLCRALSIVLFDSFFPLYSSLHRPRRLNWIHRAQQFDCVIWFLRVERCSWDMLLMEIRTLPSVPNWNHNRVGCLTRPPHRVSVLSFP